MDLVTPAVGLFIWQCVIFLVLVVVLRKFAWGPILAALNGREEDIQKGVQDAKEAAEALANAKAEYEKLMAEARRESADILAKSEAKGKEIIEAATAKASEQADRIVASAKEDIANEKKAAMAELKNEIANISLSIVEKLMRKKLDDASAQEELVGQYMKDMHLN